MSASRHTAAISGAAGWRARVLVAVGVEQPVLGERDLVEHLAAGGLSVVGERLLDPAALGVGQQPLDDLAHVGLVVDRVCVGAPEHGGVLSEQPRADRVEGGGGDAARLLFAEQVGEPQPELAGGADAEGDGEDLPRLREPGGEQPGDAVGERLGLAGARAGQQQQRPGPVADGLRLLGGEAFEQGVVCAGRPGAAGVGTRGRVRHASPPGDDR